MKYQIRGGIRQRGLASSAERQIETMTASFVTVPLSDRAEDVTPLVAAGDYVCVGTKLSDPPSGTPAHASVSGTVISTEDHLLADGSAVPAVCIKSDGQMTPDPSLAPCRTKLSETPPEQLLDMIRSAGIKTSPFDDSLAARIAAGENPDLIVSSFDDDPMIHFAHALLRTHSKAIVGGAKILLRACGARSARFAVCADDTKACFFVKEAIGDSRYLTLCPVERTYPASHPTVLSALFAGEDSDPLVVTAEECLAVYRAFAAGEPMTQRVLSLGGRAVKEPCTVRVPIGMSISEILSGVRLRRTPNLVLTGGVMNGRSAALADVPVEKATAAILAFGHSRIPCHPYLEPTCIGCGRCADVCPVGLAPGAIFRALEKDDRAEAERIGLASCISCGACAFVCPGTVNVSARLAEAKRTFSVEKNAGEEVPDETN